MKKIIIAILLTAFILPAAAPVSEASIVSDSRYRAQLRKEEKQSVKQIKALFKKHGELANKHDVKGLYPLYLDSYINNDGFDKEAYFKSIESTWESCGDLTYKTDILSIEINGDHASVYVNETASGTLIEKIESLEVAGEIHSKSKGIYHLESVNGEWYIAGETALTDESSLLYGDARYMNIEIQAPSQINAGDEYTASLKVDADDKTLIMASINSDPVIYPTKVPQNDLRMMPQSQVLERVIKANNNNINEYVIASMAISKVKPVGIENYKIYMAGLACVMKRINVVPKNNFINLEE